MRQIKIDEIYKRLNDDFSGDINERDIKISAKRVRINENIDFWINNFSFKSDTKIINDIYPFSGCLINFTLRGNVAIKALDSKINYIENSTSITTARDLLSELQTDQGQNINAGIFINSDFINDNFADIIDPYTNKFLKQSKTNPSSRLYLNQILNLNRDDPLDKLLMESKILELIYNEFSDIKKFERRNKSVILDEFDKVAILKAKEILAADIKNPPSIKELAKRIRLNEFKLKFGFKKLFNQTPYEFLHNERINQAFALAKSSEMNISEISSAVGFKSQGHFAKTFKKRYGISLKEILKTRNYYY